MFFLWGT
nr:unnamed protein product [Timema californicum]